MALRASGRLRMIHPTPSRTSKISESATVRLPPLAPIGRVGVEATGGSASKASSLEALSDSGRQLERLAGVVVQEALARLRRQLQRVHLRQHAVPLQQRVVGREADLVLAEGLHEVHERRRV